MMLSPLLQTRLIIPYCQWNGSSTCIAVVVNIDEDLVKRNLRALGYSLNDASVCLVRNNPVDILSTEIVALHDLHHIVAHISNSIAEDRSTLLIEEVQTVVDREM